jgi:urease accessory protein
MATHGPEVFSILRLETEIRAKGPLNKNLALMYLSSPALPIGTFSWSRGLESACLSGAVKDLGDLGNFLLGCLRHSLGTFDLPLMALSMVAALAEDRERLEKLNNLSLAYRESAELLLEEEEGGRAVRRLMLSLGLWPNYPAPFFVPGLSIASAMLAVSLGLGVFDIPDALESVAFGWLQNQLAAASRLLKVGQSGLQGLILDLGPELALVSQAAIGIREEDLGSSQVGLAMLSAHHELEPVRLFRS